MTTLTKNAILADILSEHIELIPVAQRFGIHLGVGDKTIQELCEANQLNADFIVTLFNVYIDENYFPEKKLSSFAIHPVIEYFEHTAESYIRDSVPNIEKHLNALIAISGGTDHKELQLLHEIFLQFKMELTLLLQQEMSRTVDYPHELLNDLKNILIRLVSGSCNQNLCYAVIFSINSLQKDLFIHNRLKTKILDPKLKELNEKELDVLKHSANAPKENLEEKKIKLTPREEEVLKLIATGYLNKEIADRLNISLNTVLTHRKNIIAKTGIKTVSGLTFYCISNGLLSPDFIPERPHK